MRVADFSRVLAGPFCTRTLCDLGAEVVKIEPPEGDLSRKLGARRAGMSGYYMQQNCGKLNVSIDLKTERGRELAAAVIARSDVLVENFRPGVMDGLGLGPAAMTAAHPGLVYCSISGFGHRSPWRDRRAFAGIAHASTGVLLRQARAMHTEPTDSVLALGDTVSGLQAVIAILAALRLRETSGRGQVIDMAMHDALLSIQEAANFHLFSDETGEEDYLCSWVYRCGEEFVALPTDPRASWPEVCAAMGMPEHLDDPRYDSYEKREARLDELEALVQGWVAGVGSADAVVARLHEHGLPAARLASLGEALESEQARVRDMTPEVDDRSGRRVPVLNTPYRFSSAAAGVRGVAAFRGEDNRRVLADLLGIDDAEVERLEADGIVSARVPQQRKSSDGD